jgi:wnt family
MKTCWKSLADLRIVSVTLLRSYYSAVEVTYRRPPKQKPAPATGTAIEGSSGGGGTRGNEKRLVPVGNVRRLFTDDDLVFYTMSPDYCLPDASLGAVGTKDR